MIRFPGLNISLEINRVAFNVFGKDVYWYGIIIAIGVLAAAYYALREAKRVSVDVNSMVDLITYGVISAIIGARLYFVLFNLKDFTNFWDVFKIWEGGIAIYGGIIGGVTAGYIYCRNKKMSFPKVLDIVAIPFLIGQAIGRWGNFVNREAFGAITNLPWRMEIYDEYGSLISVHPTFFYESLWNVIGIILLSLYKKKKKFDGELFALYVAWYGLGRSWIEQLRVDSLPYNGSFKVSQIVAIISCLISIGFIVYQRNKMKQKCE